MKLFKRIIFILTYLAFLIVLLFISIILIKNWGYVINITSRPPFVFLTRKVLGVNINVLPLDNYLIKFKSSDKYQYFYEWKPLLVEKYPVSWAPDDAYLETNKDGLNDNSEYSNDKPTGVFRIIALGDSFTQGAFVNVSNSYPKQLEKLLNGNIKCDNISKFEVLNFGVGGYDISYAAERFLTSGVKYNPDLILWFIKDDDFDEITELTHGRANKYYDSLTENEKRDLSKWNRYNEMSPELRNSNMSLWDKLYLVAKTDLLKELGRKKFSELQTQAVESVVKKTESPIIMLTFPFTSKTNKNTIISWKKAHNNIFYFDGLSDIYKLGGSYRPIDEHPNKKGYQLIAEDVFGYLKSGIFKYCNN